MLLEGSSVVVIDNINCRLDSGELCKVLTETTHGDRILGHSQTVNVPVRCAWIATGNNIQLGRWSRLVFEPDQFDGSPDLVIEMANGARHLFSAEFDKARTDLNIKRVNDERKWVPELFRGQPPDPIVGTFRLNAGAPGYLMLEGVYEGQLIQANLRRGEMKFLLLEHGFHWIHDRLFWAR